MTKPRQLAPTVGLSHDGFRFLEGRFEGLEGYVAASTTTMTQAGALRPAQLSTGTGSPLVAFTFLLARSVNRAPSWTSAPTSSGRLSVRDPPRLNRP